MMRRRSVFYAWGKVLSGRAPILSIEVTRECPLQCPGCYAYGDTHLGGDVTLRDLSDLRGTELVEGVIRVVERHNPMHVSLVGGEPLIRHRELSRILPRLSDMGVTTMVVTSAVVPIPVEWMEIPGLRVAVSVDGLPEHHDERRQPATYDRILRNIRGRQVDLSWVVTQPMMERSSYLAEYLAFWSAQPDVQRVGLSIYTPQVGEQSAETLTPEARKELVRQLPELKKRYPLLWMTDGIARAFGAPPRSPRECTFSQMSVNYTADLKTRVEPCVFGGNPDCSQCGCGATAVFHWIGNIGRGPVKISHVMRGSIAVGSLVNRFRPGQGWGVRWNPTPSQQKTDPSLVRIDS